MAKIPLASMERIMQSVDIERISDSAKIELRAILEEKAKDISRSASQISKHAKRHTILKADIELAK